MSAPLADADGLDELLEPLGVGLLAGDRQGQENVLLCREHRQQIEELENEADLVASQLRQLLVVEVGDLLTVDRDAALARLVERGQGVHQCRLAGAGRAHDRRQARLFDLDADVAKRMDRCVALAVVAAEASRGDDGMRGTRASRR